MKHLLTISFLLLLFSCKKETEVIPDSSPRVSVVDITPEVYQFMSGKWKICRDHLDATIVVDPKNTSQYEFIINPGRVSGVLSDTLIISTVTNTFIQPTDTILFALHRTYNINRITGYKLKDSSEYDFMFEKRPDNTFIVSGWVLCR